MGIIVDENDQEIPFYIANVMEWPVKDEPVAFEIVLTALGLMATAIFPFHRATAEENAAALPNGLSEPLFTNLLICPDRKI